jgi:O-antigen/teichoic acid export membrane protein
MQLGLTRIVSDTGMTLTRQLAGTLISLCSILLIAHELGPEGAGRYAVALLIPQILSQLLNMGLAPANVFFFASGRLDLGQIWPALRDASVVLILLGLGVGIAFINLLGEFAFPGIDPDLLLVALGIFPFAFSAMMIQSIFQALQVFRVYNLMVLSQPITGLILLCLLWMTDNFVLGQVITVTGIAYVIPMVIGLAALRKHTAMLAKCTDYGVYLRPAIGYGSKAHLGNIAAFLNYRLDLFLVNFFVSPTAAGLYSVATRLVEQLWIISKAASIVILPQLASLQGDEESRSALTPLVTRFVLWITLLGAGVMAALAQPLIILLFGSPFTGATLAVYLLLPGILIVSAERVMANDLAARGLVGLNFIFAVAVLLVNLIGNLVLIPLLGIEGAAIASSLASLLVFIPRLIVQQSISRMTWWRYLIPLREDLDLLKSKVRGMRET